MIKAIVCDTITPSSFGDDPRVTNDMKNLAKSEYERVRSIIESINNETTIINELKPMFRQIEINNNYSSFMSPSSLESLSSSISASKELTKYIMFAIATDNIKNLSLSNKIKNQLMMKNVCRNHYLIY